MTVTGRLNANNDLSIVDGRIALVTSRDEVVQRVSVALQHYLGEYFLNTTTGVPYYEDVLGQRADISGITAILRRQVLLVPGVTGIRSFSVEFNRDTRQFVPTVDVETTFDES